MSARNITATLNLPLKIIPDTTQAEKWITPFVFLFKGKYWEIKPDGEIVLIGGHEDVRTD